MAHAADEEEQIGLLIFRNVCVGAAYISKAQDGHYAHLNTTGSTLESA